MSEISDHLFEALRLKKKITLEMASGTTVVWRKVEVSINAEGDVRTCPWRNCRALNLAEAVTCLACRRGLDNPGIVQSLRLAVGMTINTPEDGRMTVVGDSDRRLVFLTSDGGIMRPEWEPEPRPDVPTVRYQMRLRDGAGYWSGGTLDAHSRRMVTRDRWLEDKKISQVEPILWPVMPLHHKDA